MANKAHAVFLEMLSALRTSLRWNTNGALAPIADARGHSAVHIVPDATSARRAAVESTALQEMERAHLFDVNNDVLVALYNRIEHEQFSAGVPDVFYALKGFPEKLQLPFARVFLSFNLGNNNNKRFNLNHVPDVTDLGLLITEKVTWLFNLQSYSATLGWKSITTNCLVDKVPAEVSGRGIKTLEINTGNLEDARIYMHLCAFVLGVVELLNQTPYKKSKPTGSMKAKLRKLEKKGVRSVPSAYYYVDLEPKAAYRVARKAAVKFLGGYNLSYQFDVRGHMNVRVRSGKLPLEEKEARKLTRYGYTIYTDTEPAGKDQEDLELRGREKKEGEWIALKRYWTKPHRKGPENSQYVPAVRVLD